MSKYLQTNREFPVILAAIGILLILFVPMPPGMLDLMLILNISWALTVLMLTFLTAKPLAFSTFPPLLLLTTLFRLGLNISATRLILADAQAGKVIDAMGQYVVRGNYIMGIVVFLILIIVQYVVITSGAQRVAEVAARFTLDSMPGKQMSIDADLNMGLISREQAKAQRHHVEQEANFYGAMDGASKFVKGDAIAGILIMLVNILGGLGIGLLQKGMSLSEALHTYTLLTIGDGLVTQIPALVISIATGIIVTRAATDARLGSAVTRQLAAFPGGLAMVCIALLGLLTIRGMPKLPVFAVLFLFAMAARWARTQVSASDTPADTEPTLDEKMRIYPVEVALNPTLRDALAADEERLLEQVAKLREQIAMEFGFLLPEVRFRQDPALAWPAYRIMIHGDSGTPCFLYPDKILVLLPGHTEPPEGLEGTPDTDPVYGLPAIWANPDQKAFADKAGLRHWNTVSVLAAHLREEVLNHLPELLSGEESARLLEQPHIRNLRDELVPGLLTASQVLRIFQKLLAEQVSVRPLETILEVLLEHAKTLQDPDMLTELVRMRLGLPICRKLLGNQSSLAVLTLDPELEQQLLQGFSSPQQMVNPGVSESLLHGLARAVEQMLAARKRPVLLCASTIRRNLRQLTGRIMPHLTVLAMSEIPVSMPVESFGIVTALPIQEAIHD